jgi:putative zinc finger protein
MTIHDLNCARLDDKLADYLEGDLPAGERIALEAHVASCVRCTALVRDLEHIRTDAGELGELAPSRDLWSGIAERIETPVVPLTVRPIATPNVERRRGGERLRLAAIAAALVAVTAGVTYTLTIAGGGASDSTNVAVTTSRDSLGDSSRTTDGRVIPPSVGTGLASANDSARKTNDPQDSTAEPRATNVNAAPAGSSEIDRLRALFIRNRGQMDPRTAAIIEANLKVIDDAIAQSKAALAQDPASRFLTNQLNNAMDKKLELLRTAAQLPSRT